MSWSRGAWVGVGVALVVVAVLQSRRAFVLSTIAAFVLTMAVLLSSINIIPGVVAERFSGIGDYFGIFDVRGVKVDDANFAIVERMAHWQAAAEMFADHPVLGVGIGNYVPAYPLYALPRWSDPLGHAHNYYLNVAAETGAVGLFGYLVLWGAALWQGWRAVRALNGLARGIAAGLLGMMTALSIHNGFDNLFVHGMAVQVGIGLAMVSALTNRERTGEWLNG
jgi:putative inorganic carbon (HCO3(-)) transporter